MSIFSSYLPRLCALIGIGSVAAAALAPLPAHAQEAGNEEPQAPEGTPAPTATVSADEAALADGEVIEMTGSLIKRDNLTSVGHITVMSADEIALTSAATINELLEKLPSVTLQGVNKNNNFDGNGQSFVDLRNLGLQRVLVLVNGRRFVTSGGDAREGVDLGNIPVAMIERVEVLLDGASAVYGSDAVGGVINFILKEDFEGFQLDVDSGISGEGDGGSMRVSGTMGQRFDRGSITVNATYLFHDNLVQRTRDWARDPVVAAQYEDGTDLDGDGDPNGIAHVVGSSVVPFGRSGNVIFLPDDEAGTSFQAANPFDPAHRYNYADTQWLTAQQKRTSTTLLGKYDLGRQTHWYMEGMYTNRDSRTRLAPVPLGLGGTRAYPGGFLVPVDNPYIPADYLATLEPGTESIAVLRRLVEVGDRISDINADTFRVVTGIEGVLPGNLSWDTYINYGRSRSTVAIRNFINMSRVMETVTPTLCEANAARGCVLGDYFGPEELDRAVVDYIRYTDVEITEYQHLGMGAVLTGDITRLPYGALAFATGVAAREEKGASQPSALTLGGDAPGFGLTEATRGRYRAGEVFGELSIPLLRRVQGAHELSLDLAGRYSTSDTFDGASTYRAALSYAPTRDMRIRGSYATAFRAPGISDLYGGAADTYPALQDPCDKWDTDPDIDPAVRANCEAANVPAGYDQSQAGGIQIRTTVGGNPDLEPENAHVINLGMVLWPSFIADFTATVDYYDVTVDNAIESLNAQSILNDCYSRSDIAAGDLHPRCSLLQRDANGVVRQLDALAQNIGQLETSGIDMTLGYGFDLARVGLPGIGRVDLTLQGNYLLDYTETVDGRSEAFAGTIARNAGTYAHLRWVQRTSFRRDNWRLSSTLRYIGGADVFGIPEENRDSQPYSTIPAVAYWDLAGRYDTRRWSVILGIENALDKDPPFFLEGQRNANGASYDFVGRYFFTRARYKF